MTSFEEGATVIVRSDGDEWDNLDGQKGTILEVGEWNEHLIEFDDGVEYWIDEDYLEVIEEEKPMAEHNFEAGDRVHVETSTCSHQGRDVTVTSVSDDRLYFKTDDNRACHHPVSGFRLISKKGSVMNNPVTAITEINLSADDRLLRQYGFEETVGKPSTQGKEALTNLLWSEKRTELANLIRKAIAAQKQDVESVAQTTGQ